MLILYIMLGGCLGLAVEEWWREHRRRQRDPYWSVNVDKPTRYRWWTGFK